VSLRNVLDKIAKCKLISCNCRFG